MKSVSGTAAIKVAVLLLSFCLPACHVLLAAPSPDLLGTMWIVTELNGEPYQPVAGEEAFSLRLQRDGHMTAFTGCNHFTGAYQHSARVLRVGPFDPPLRRCEPGVMHHEKEMVRAMEGASSFRIDGNTLSLFNPIGIALVRFEPARR